MPTEMPTDPVPLQYAITPSRPRESGRGVGYDIFCLAGARVVHGAALVTLRYIGWGRTLDAVARVCGIIGSRAEGGVSRGN